MYINTGSHPKVTINSIEPGADIPPGWITVSSQCSGLWPWGQNSVVVGFLAGPTLENPTDVIPSGDDKEILRVKLILPSIPSPSNFLIYLYKTPSDCDGHVYANHIVVGSCDTSVSLLNGTYNSNYGWFVAPLSGTCRFFRRGDCNNNGLVAGYIGDIVFLLCHLFQICPCPDPPCHQPACEAACDANDDGTVELTDAIYLLDWMFKTGAPPPAPYPSCGLDPTEPTLPCETSICP
jgi:hypothetical protein